MEGEPRGQKSVNPQESGNRAGQAKMLMRLQNAAQRRNTDYQRQGQGYQVECGPGFTLQHGGNFKHAMNQGGNQKAHNHGTYQS